jgi:hypothetical protein
MDTQISIAPTSELIRFLCLFRRTFIAMQRFVREQDEDGIILMAWIADALHNVPGMLWRYDPAQDWNGPQQMKRWMAQFPDGVRSCAPPDHIQFACINVFSAAGATAELALAEDLSDLDLAPPEQMAAYLDLFYRACITIRWRQAPHMPWRTLDEHWASARSGKIEAMSRMAELLAQAPVGLVHWGQFDRDDFTRQARSIWQTWPAGFGLDRQRSQESQ